MNDNLLRGGVGHLWLTIMNQIMLWSLICQVNTMYRLKIETCICLRCLKGNNWAFFILNIKIKYPKIWTITLIKGKNKDWNKGTWLIKVSHKYTLAYVHICYVKRIEAHYFCMKCAIPTKLSAFPHSLGTAETMPTSYWLGLQHLHNAKEEFDGVVRSLRGCYYYCCWT